MMDNTNYLIDHIFNIIIEHSQKDPKFKWGDRIEYTPNEFIIFQSLQTSLTDYSKKVT